MRRNLAYGGVARAGSNRSVSSVACLAFVALLAAAFWAGAVFIAQHLIGVSHSGF